MGYELLAGNLPFRGDVTQIRSSTRTSSAADFGIERCSAGDGGYSRAGHSQKRAVSTQERSTISARAAKRDRFEQDRPGALFNSPATPLALTILPVAPRLPSSASRILPPISITSPKSPPASARSGQRSNLPPAKTNPRHCLHCGYDRIAALRNPNPAPNAAII
jgi:hypothetical protein